MYWPRVREANPLFSVYIALWRSTALAIIYNVVGRQRNLGLRCHWNCVLQCFPFNFVWSQENGVLSDPLYHLWCFRLLFVSHHIVANVIFGCFWWKKQQRFSCWLSYLIIIRFKHNIRNYKHGRYGYEIFTDITKLYDIRLYTSPWSRFELTTSVVIGTDCIGSCNSNYHTITATTAPEFYCILLLYCKEILLSKLWRLLIL